MDDFNLDNFELLLNKNTKRPSALYNTTDRNKSTLKPQDVLDTVFSQIKTIQLADGRNSKVIIKDSNLVKSSFLTINKLPMYNQVTNQSNTFETQCVSNTQLINITEDIEALIDTHKGMTQEFDTAFTHTNVTENNTTLAHDKLDKDNSKLVETQEFDTTFTQTNVDDTVSFIIDKTDEEVLKKDAKNSPSNKINQSLIDNEGELNRHLFEIKCESTAKENTISASNINHQDHSEKSSSKLENSSQTNVFIDNDAKNSAIKESNHLILSNDTADTNIEEVRSSSPVIKLKTIAKGHSPIVVPLESFERFERLAIPFIDSNDDFNTCKHLVNSQILKGELLLNTDEDVIFNECKSNPTTNRSCEIIQNTDELNNVINLNSGKDKEKLSDSLKDEILFSSDEENDFIYRRFQDMPLTSALDTSFGDHSDILEDNMYVGFQTASNKSIQVFTDSFQRAQLILNEDNNSTDFSFTELVEICEKKNISKGDNAAIKAIDLNSAVNKDNEKRLIKSNINYLSNEEKNIVDPTIKEKLPERQYFVGFKTASNQNIDITSKALDIGKKVLMDIDFDEKLDLVDQNENTNNEEPNITDNVINSDKNYPENYADGKINDDLIIQEFENIEMSLEEKDTSYDDGNRTSRFKTASNKNIDISDAAKVKIKEVFPDVDMGEINDNSKEVYPKNTEDSIKILHLNDNADEFIGFKTANNKNIKISTQALAKTKDIFQEIDAEISKPFSIESKNNKFQGIQKRETSAKSNTISNETDDVVFKNLENETQISSNVFEGFKTASNKHVIISKEALLRSNKIFQELDGNSEKNNENLRDIAGFSGFKTANNKAIDVSEESIAKSKTLFENLGTIDINSIKNKPKNTNNTFTGFQTASNKHVGVSAHALELTKKIFQNIGDTELIIKTNSDSECKFKGFQTASNKEVAVTKEALEASKKLLDEFNIDQPTCSSIGFKTASNKNVKVSEEVLTKCKKLFADLDDLPENSFKVNEHFGFRTANNKEVEISTEALEKTKNLCDIVYPEITEQGIFKGFQTASKKRVEVSKEAMAKSKQIFEDIDTISNNNDNKNLDLNKHIADISNKSIFQTANNENIDGPEDTNIKSRKILKDSSNTNTNNKLSANDFNHDKNRTSKDKYLELDTNENFNTTINTQVLNNFQENLNTEDFRETPRQCKRSGSPILSCPKAKKRKKFETPYKDEKDKKVENIKTDIQNTCAIKIKFNEMYKKNKVLKLKQLKFCNDNKRKIDPYITKFNLDNILNFEFASQRNDITETKFSVNELKNIFISAVNKNFVPEGWLDNHLKLILWKLLSYESVLADSSFLCTVQSVIDQLKYRYDRELYNAERSALRKILERDDVSTKTIVLCVAGVYLDGVSVTSVTSAKNIELLLTDGWYFIKATIDKMLTELVVKGKIIVGSKIVTCGAELSNCGQGLAPWEDTSAVRLKLFGNSTRPASWDTKLGYARAPILNQLSSVKVDGGKISRLRVFVARVYPLLYLEKFEDGSTVTRSERLEHLHQMKYEAETELMMERIYEEVQKEFSDQESQDSELNDSGKRKYGCSGSQIFKMMKLSKDPMEFHEQLTSSQVQLLQEHTNKHNEKLIQTIQDRVKEKIKCRNVVTLARGRIASVRYDKIGFTKGMLSIWKPNEDVLELFKEGAWIDIMNVIPTAIRYSEIQISAGRQSMFRSTKCKNEVLPHLQSLKRTIYRISDVTQNSTMSTEYNEIDTVGIVFLIDPSNEEFESNKNFQNVYLADADKNIISVNFWGGVKKFGFENILDTGQILACANLQKRAGNTGRNIPQFRVTEFSHFTKTPKNVQAKEIMDDINKKLFGLDRRKFCGDCVAIKNNYTAIKCFNKGENESPYRFNRSDYSFARNKMFIDTPVGVKPNKNEDTNFNLTGLDFESSFKQDVQESPETMLRRRKVNERIAKLKMYGEPPPLSSINIIDKSINAKNSFKSPLASTNSSAATPNFAHGVSTTNNLPEESRKRDMVRERSPVLSMKRESGRSVPVKLNFENEKTDDLENHFAEEFDGSPPLSLD